MDMLYTLIILEPYGPHDIAIPRIERNMPNNMCCPPFLFGGPPVHPNAFDWCSFCCI